MNEIKKYRSEFLNYLEGTMSEEEKARFGRALSSSAELQADLQSYRRIVLMEQETAHERFELDERFVSKVMAEVKYRPGFLRRLFMELRHPSRPLVAGIASLAVLTLGVAVFYSPEFRAYQAAKLAPLSKQAELAGAGPGSLRSEGDSNALSERIIAEKKEKEDGSSMLAPMKSASEGEEIPAAAPEAQAKALGGQGGEVIYNDTRVNSTLAAVLDFFDAPSADDRVLERRADKDESLSAEREQRTAEIHKRVLPSLKQESRGEIAKGSAVDRASEQAGQGERVLQEPMKNPSSQMVGDVTQRFAADTAISMEAARTRQAGSADASLLQQAPIGAMESALAPAAPGQPVTSIMPYPRHPVDHSWVQQQNNERYNAFIENAPTFTSAEPMSTFSIDVDTGSYTNVRRFLQQGQLPPADAVRIEEFVNYFDYSYPSQGSEPFTTNFEMAPSPDEDGKYLLKIGIKAQDVAGIDKETPWNLVFLIDVSGSMNDANKLPLVQKSLELLANNMRKGDTVSIVTYAGSSGLLLPPTGMKERAKILSAIQSLGAGGSTNGSAGILQAYQTAKEAFIKGGVNRVILATDGDFNVGTTSQAELIRLIEEKRKSGITLTTLGFGTGNYNEGMMEQLANKGNGNYFYIDSFREARKVFEEKLQGTIQVVAKDVKLQIEFNPAHVAQYRLVGYENRKLRNEDFANDKIDAGEIGVGHTVTALYEVVLTGTEAAKALMPEHRYAQAASEASAVKAQVTKGSDSEFANELAFLKIRFKEPEGNRSKLLTFPLTREKVKDSFAAASSDFRFAAAVSAFASKLRESQFAPELSFGEIEKIASGAVGEDSAGYRREFVELVRNVEALAPGATD